MPSRQRAGALRRREQGRGGISPWRIFNNHPGASAVIYPTADNNESARSRTRRRCRYVSETTRSCPFNRSAATSTLRCLFDGEGYKRRIKPTTKLTPKPILRRDLDSSSRAPPGSSPRRLVSPCAITLCLLACLLRSSAYTRVQCVRPYTWVSDGTLSPFVSH